MWKTIQKTMTKTKIEIGCQDQHCERGSPGKKNKNPKHTKNPIHTYCGHTFTFIKLNCQLSSPQKSPWHAHSHLLYFIKLKCWSSSQRKSPGEANSTHSAISHAQPSSSSRQHRSSAPTSSAQHISDNQKCVEPNGGLWLMTSVIIMILVWQQIWSN